jgi:hypothetical protein
MNPFFERASKGRVEYEFNQSADYSVLDDDEVRDYAPIDPSQLRQLHRNADDTPYAMIVSTMAPKAELSRSARLFPDLEDGA